MRTSSSTSQRALLGFAARQPGDACASASMICAPTVMCGVSEVSGSWKIMVIFEPRSLFSCGWLMSENFLAAILHAAGRRAVGGKKPDRRQEELALARAGFAHHAQAFAFVDRESSHS